jgi:UDP-N-acetylmuramoyl-tripeptide--D-alanyl-D-alanine ligase
VAAALKTLAALRRPGGCTVAVLGEMAELGDGAPAYHEEVGALLRELGIEHVIAVGELARAYGGEWVTDAASASVRLGEVLQPGNVVLVKGSRSVGLEVVAENITS